MTTSPIDGTEITALNATLAEARAAFEGVVNPATDSVLVPAALLGRLGKATKRLRDMLLAGAEPRPARARRGDPATSRDAASSIPPEQLRESQRAVLACFRRCGMMTDEELIRRYELHRATDNWQPQSRSGIRTRRTELVRAGHVVRAGQRKAGRGWRTVWRHVNEKERLL